MRLFISYRSNPDRDRAGRLRAALSASFGGEAVFLATESLTPGAPFPEEIARAVARCDVCLLVIGPDWAESFQTYEAGAAANAEDWVKREVCLALESGCRVVPVLVGGASMPGARALPEGIAAVSGLHAHVQHDDSWERDARALVEIIRRQGSWLDKAMGRGRLIAALSLAVAVLWGGWITGRSLAAPGYLEAPSFVLNRRTTADVGAVTVVARIAPVKRLASALRRGRQGKGAVSNDLRLLQRANDEFISGDYTRARDDYRALAGRFPDVADLRVNFSVSLVLTGAADRVPAVVEAALEMPYVEPETRLALLGNLAGAYLALGKSDSATAVAARMASARPEDVVAENIEGVSAYLRGDVNAALGSFRAAARKGRTPIKDINLATALFDGRDSAGARKLLLSLKAVKSVQAEREALLSRLLIAEGRVSEAQVVLQSLMSAQPARADVRFNLGVACLRLGDARAATYFEQAFRLDEGIRARPAGDLIGVGAELWTTQRAAVPAVSPLRARDTGGAEIGGGAQSATSTAVNGGVDPEVGAPISAESAELPQLIAERDSLIGLHGDVTDAYRQARIERLSRLISEARQRMRRGESR